MRSRLMDDRLDAILSLKSLSLDLMLHLSPRRCTITFLVGLLHFWINTTNVCLRALILFDCCIYLISLPTIAVFFAHYSSRFCSVRFWKWVTAHLYPTHPWHGSDPCVSCKRSHMRTSVQPSVKSNRSIVFANSTLSRAITSNVPHQNFLPVSLASCISTTSVPTIHILNEPRVWPIQ